MMEIDRRTWIRLAGALGALCAVETELEAQEARPQGAPAQRVSKEMLHQTLELIGLQFTPEQETMMLPAVNRNLTSYEALRKIAVPLDTDPAFRFDPRLAGVRYPSGPSRCRLSRQARAPKKRTWNSLDELAFLPVTELAPLVRSRQVSPVDLAKMYLVRLKRYGPKLNCVITLTEELALAQAERA